MLLKVVYASEQSVFTSDSHIVSDCSAEGNSNLDCICMAFIIIKIF